MVSRHVSILVCICPEAANLIHCCDYGCSPRHPYCTYRREQWRERAARELCPPSTEEQGLSGYLHMDLHGTVQKQLSDYSPSQRGLENTACGERSEKLQECTFRRQPGFGPPTHSCTYECQRYCSCHDITPSFIAVLATTYGQAQTTDDQLSLLH